MFLLKVKTCIFQAKPFLLYTRGKCENIKYCLLGVIHNIYLTFFWYTKLVSKSNKKYRFKFYLSNNNITSEDTTQTLNQLYDNVTTVNISLFTSVLRFVPKKYLRLDNTIV